VVGGLAGDEDLTVFGNVEQLADHRPGGLKVFNVLNRDVGLARPRLETFARVGFAAVGLVITCAIR
jgi:hypothetical protein